MAELYTYNATHLTTIRDGSVSFTQSAELGQVGSGQVTIEDTAGTLSIVGQKDFSATQSSCSTPLTFRGFVGERTYGRLEAAPKVTAAREINVSLEDLNSMLGHRLIYQAPGLTVAAGGKRPAETILARGTWLMGSGFVAFANNGRCSFPSNKNMTASDYRYQHAGDVLADMALAAGGYNYHVNDWGSGPELTFRDDNASTADTSTLRISNVLSDADSVTLNPKETATLRRSPAKVISRMAYNWEKGTVVEDRAATATTFNGERSGTASNSNVRSASKASEEAQAQLWQLHTEEDLIDCEIDAVTAAQINLILPGMRIQAKFSHLNTEGYGSFTYFRVLERTVRPMNAEGALYSLGLKLSPQEAAQPAGAIVQSLFAFYGTGGSASPPYTHLTQAPSIGNTLLAIITNRVTGVTSGTISAPNTSSALPRWGAGAWTELPLSVGSYTETYVERTSGDGEHHGMSIFYKTVDSTSQDGVIGEDYCNVAIYELSGINMATATLARANNQSAANTFDVGTLGTISSGSLGFMVVQSVPDETVLAGITPASGWTTDWYRGNYPIWYAQATFPVVWIGHAIGAGATVDPSLVNAGAARRWCGLAIKVTP